MADSADDRLPKSVRLSVVGGAKLEPITFRGTPPPRPPFVADGLMHPLGTTVIYGHGGVGKGWVACYVYRALVDEGHSPIVIDLESVQWEWQERLYGMGVDGGQYLYVPAPFTMAFALQVEALAVEHGWTHAILDSASVARGSVRDSDSGGQDAAIALFRHVRQIGIPTLMLAHEAKKGDGPIGSVQYTAQARLVWQAVAVDSMTTELRMRKANDRPLEGKPLTFTRVIGEAGAMDVVKNVSDGARSKPDPERNMSAQIVSLMRGRDRNLDAHEVQRFLHDLGYDVAMPSLLAMLSKLVKQGRLIRPARGRYAYPIEETKLT